MVDNLGNGVGSGAQTSSGFAKGEGKGKTTSLLDPKDYKFPQMPESCSLEYFKK